MLAHSLPNSRFRTRRRTLSGAPPVPRATHRRHLPLLVFWLLLSALLPEVRAATAPPVRPDMSRIAGWGSSSMQGAGKEFAAMAGALGASYFQGGKGGELSSHIAARLGSIPARLKVRGGVIPASGAITVTASNMPPSTSMQAYDGTLAGVPGRLSSTATQLTFTRLKPGKAIRLSGEQPFIPEMGKRHRTAVTLLWMGKNDLNAGERPEVVARRTQASCDWLAPRIKRCIVLGHFNNTGTPANAALRQRIRQVNAAYRARHGRQFIDIQALLTSQEVWSLAGIRPTAADLRAQALGNKPPSLSSDDAHFNAAGYAAVRRLVERRLHALGWY